MGRSVVAVVVAAVVAASPASGTPAQAPKRGGTVVQPHRPEPSCLNFFGPCPTRPELPWFTQVLEGAFEIGPDLTYRPNLVSHVDTVSKGPFTLVYHIRPEARWSDGVPVTARDFVFTFKAFVTHELSATALGRTDERESYNKIRRVRAVDAKTLRVVFRTRFAYWRDLFQWVLPRHALAGEELREIWRDAIDNPKTGRPIGSGPFLVEPLELGKQLTLVRNPRYWGPHTAYLDRLVFRFRFAPSTTTLGEAFRKREFDLLPIPDAPPELLAELRTAGAKIVTVPALAWEHIAIRVGSGGHPALKSKLVRRALAYGIDRVAIARQVYAHIDPKLPPSDSAVFVSNSPFYEPNWRRYRYRPVLAHRLLEQAGCRRGADGVFVCGDQRLSLRFVTTAGNPPRELALQLAQAQLSRAGIEVVPVFAPSQALFGASGILGRGEFDLALFQWAFGPSGFHAVYRCKEESNFYGYCSRLTNRDLVQADLIVEQGQRARVLNAADRKLARDVPVIPLFQVPLVVAYRATIENVVPNPDTSDGITWNSEDWWLER